MNSLNPIAEVVDAGFCTGCGACASIASAGKVEMRIAENGFYRPTATADLSEVEASQFRKVCPGVIVEHDGAPDGDSVHPIWGPLKSCRTGYSVDPDLRRFGSSGGVISALALYLLDSGKVDFVVQNVPADKDPFGNQIQISRSKSDVLKSAGSRYGPSAPLASIKTLLDSGKTFAFVGKPCDVAALRALSRLDGRVEKQVPFMLSFMCAGIPSRGGTLAVIKRLQMEPEDVASFRYRGDGWPGKAKAVSHGGRVAEMDYATSWGEILNRHLQFRCKICPDGTGEFADIVCADAWYGQNGYPSFEERDGRSLVLTRSARGEHLLMEAALNNAVKLTDLDVGEVAKMQPYQVMRKQVVWGRVAAARLALGSAPKYRNMGLMRASLTAKPVTWLRNAIGTFKRAKGEVA